MTLSNLPSPKGNDRQTILDTTAQVSTKALQRNTRILAEALACSVYPKMESGHCTGELFAGSWEPKESSLEGWLKLVTSYPRHPTLISDRNSGNLRNIQICSHLTGLNKIVPVVSMLLFVKDI